MRRANGTGNVFKMKGKARRNPWRVRITVGWEVDELAGKSKQIVKTLGYYPSRREAEAALNEYFEDPYNIGDKDMTFQELYNSWSEKYFPTLSGVSSVRTITSAYRYMHIIYKMKVRDIRVRHLEECLKDAYIISDKGKDKGEKRYAREVLESVLSGCKEI
ncbi:MAG: hypothetical protein K2O16_01650 [Lachnospiraceae bacterium]|nr:hypothetical protein [Lachnospiraceae bacterium]